MHKQTEDIAIGSICAGLFAMAVFGGIADLRLAGKDQRSLTAAASLTQPACEPPTGAAIHGDDGCTPKTRRILAYYQARMDALAQN